MFEIDSKVLMKILDDSPKFRREYIRDSINNDEATVIKVCEMYKLRLITEIYFMDLSINTYNSSKRKRLKSQELLLIKKIQIIENFKMCLSEFEQSVKEIDTMYAENFDYNFNLPRERLYSEKVVKDMIDSYFEFNSERENNQL